MAILLIIQYHQKIQYTPSGLVLVQQTVRTCHRDYGEGYGKGASAWTRPPNRPDPNGLIPLSATCRLRGTAGEGDGWKPMSDGTNRPKGPGAIWTNQIAGGYPIRES